MAIFLIQIVIFYIALQFLNLLAYFYIANFLIYLLILHGQFF